MQLDKWKIVLGIIVVLLSGLAVLIFNTLPIKRVGLRSQLVMLGDLNDDNKWDDSDLVILRQIVVDPFSVPAYILHKSDMNRDGRFDFQDTLLLATLVRVGDPYRAEEQAHLEGRVFPRPREFFEYESDFEYVQRPLVLLSDNLASESPLKFLHQWKSRPDLSAHESQLLEEVYSEAMRFSSAYRIREAGLDSVEQKYAADHVRTCDSLFEAGEFYVLLLNLIGLVEDAETLRYRDQQPFIQRILYYRDYLRDILTSPAYDAFSLGQIRRDSVVRLLESGLKDQLQLDVRLDTLPAPRNYLQFRSYRDRFVWQFYKSKSRRDQFLHLVLFAQNDRRYLRAVSHTTRKHEDLILENHNLPMILLFREALSTCGGDKRSAIGLLDEAIRIPFAWVKSIPLEKLPASVALENFLLPGNKEDGSDKSRHWNVFGGVALYRSPQEALILAFEREVTDLKGSNQTPEGMKEFIRDIIADVNGIYYVMSINENLLRSYVRADDV